MVRLTRIYTRTGDGGDTRLADMSVARKTDPRVEAYGDVDETNSALGVALALGQLPAEVTRVLRTIQNELFDLGADLATRDVNQPGALRIVDAQVERLEQEIDAINAALAPLRSFVLPGGSAASAALHLARTVCRRAERAVVALAGTPGETVNAAAIRYLNRLSDLLFVAARRANGNGAGDVLWKPGATRTDQDAG